MHTGSAHLLERRVLPDHHLDHARRTEIHGRVPFDHDHDVAERRDVRAPRGRRAEETADLRHASREPVLVVEDPPRATTAGEQLDLIRQPGAGRIDEPEDRHLVLQRVLGEPHDLLHRAGTPRARLHRRVVRHHAHRPPVDGADARDHSVGGQVPGERVGEEPVLDEGTLIEEQREAVANEELVLARELVPLLVEIAFAGALGRGPQFVAHA